MRHLILQGPSLRNKRFRGVGELRKSEERDFAGEKNGASPPSLVFCLSPHAFFAREKHRKYRFSVFSLLPNPTETLATGFSVFFNRENCRHKFNVII